jgi:hypothetical protein
VYDNLITNQAIANLRLVQSLAVLNTNQYDKLANQGETGTIRFWNELANTDANLSSDAAADVAVGLAVTQGSGKYRKMFLNQVWATASLVENISDQPVLDYIKTQTDRYWSLEFQRRVIAVLQGALADSIANHGSDMLVDVSATNATKVGMSKDLILQGAMTMVDQFQNLKAIIVHPVVYEQIAKDIINVQQSFGADVGQRNSFVVETYMGLQVIVSSQLPVTAQGGATGTDAATKYLSILCGAGSVLWGNGNPHRPSAIQIREEQGNGEGVESLYERKQWIIQPNGFSFTDNTITNGYNISTAQLKLGANWSRIAATRQQVPTVFLLCNDVTV